ncbi:Biopolymer transport protein ExbB [BD1-7 clade bacterium]|uniref:Biopolymer transport protein ExbB n=1 Tax=BD1-7 clade bacterium TaxID=2029982 RepID=A0A5S9NR98_9GAMM|nr:Biopolymer transport protein ExbB [BD1-7 clade bacterium]CAA0093018.1 Biopolymer transport protein ExbB [BD1-7 clade bacterium]
MNRSSLYAVLGFVVGLSFSSFSFAQNQTSSAGEDDLGLLLEQMQNYQQQEKKLYRDRERRFLNARNQQKKLVRDAKAAFLKAQKTNNPIQQRVDARQQQIDALKLALDAEVTELGDVYSIHNEFAGDFAARMRDSLTQTQLPEREAKLEALLHDEQLPSIEDMQALWMLVQQEMIEAGRSRRFNVSVFNVAGEAETQSVVRLGTFTLANSDGFLQYLPETQELLQPQRQSASSADLRAFYQQQSGIHASIIDPTRGTLLGVLGQAPDLMERIRQGREVGLAIIAVGGFGLLIALIRLLGLSLTQIKMRKQLKQIDQPQTNNPLGRVLVDVQELESADQNLLQSRLDEAILKEIPALERGQGLIKLLAAIAPLMGLLGTVIGMIATFQSISLFGSGDPKLMASGISQALVTTVLGLVAAIPLLLAHNLVAALSRSQIQVLDEQSAGVLARHIEASSQHGGQQDV